MRFGGEGIARDCQPPRREGEDRLMGFAFRRLRDAPARYTPLDATVCYNHLSLLLALIRVHSGEINTGWRAFVSSCWRIVMDGWMGCCHRFPSKR